MEENDEEPDENKPKKDDEQNIAVSAKEEEKEVDDDNLPQKQINSEKEKSFIKKLEEKKNETSLAISKKVTKYESEYRQQSKVIQEAEASPVPDVTVSDDTTRYATFNCNSFFQKRNPFIHDPPQPEEPRPRISNPSCPREYLINFREDLADFQESHGLPRTRDYSFLSLGLALAQETARSLCSLFFMFVELFPILAIVSLILRFALDKLIEILETSDVSEKVKKSVIFSVQMLIILIPLWIFIVTVILPLLALIYAILKKVFRVQKGKHSKASSKKAKPKEKIKRLSCFFQL